MTLKPSLVGQIGCRLARGDACFNHFLYGLAFGGQQLSVEPWFKLVNRQMQGMQNKISCFVDGVACAVSITQIGRKKATNRIPQPVAYRLKVLIWADFHANRRS